ncbi:hypothetical protein [Streptomyces inhibens]|uniref:hypothetical protein n=1 Tax=Streptomyces inhibens TaxID=2293571 RepID=UPI001EE7331E|nr:hypothetical protein [Streptomyces inhibens]UKY54701.1 hypothetical protein KI385_41845 [Streptomyces inhibens]
MPEQVDSGREDDGTCFFTFFTERSVGESSLHEMAVADYRQPGHVSHGTIEAPPASPAGCWQPRHAMPARRRSGAAVLVRVGRLRRRGLHREPGPDTEGTRALVDAALERLRTVAMCESHLDYGLPNAFPGGVIDRQRHALAPTPHFRLHHRPSHALS